VFKGDALSYHAGMEFTTKDMDNDLSLLNCAGKEKEGWWYRNCSQANLNGIFGAEIDDPLRGPGITWTTWNGHSLRKVVLKIRVYHDKDGHEEITPSEEEAADDEMGDHEKLNKGEKMMEKIKALFKAPKLFAKTYDYTYD